MPDGEGVHVKQGNVRHPVVDGPANQLLQIPGVLIFDVRRDRRWSLLVLQQPAAGHIRFARTDRDPRVLFQLWEELRQQVVDTRVDGVRNRRVLLDLTEVQIEEPLVSLTDHVHDRNAQLHTVTLSADYPKSSEGAADKEALPQDDTAWDSSRASVYRR